MTKLISTALTPEEVQSHRLAIMQTASILQASETLIGTALDPAVPGSAIDRANKANLRDPYEQTRLLLYSAEDHLRTLLAVLESGQLPTFSLYSLLRPAAEAIARCAYLLDPGLDEKQRLARGLNIRLENLIEQNKVARDQPFFESRVQHLEERAIHNGVEVLRSASKNGKQRTSGFGERPKTEIELFSTYVDAESGELLYRYLSGHVHSMPWVKVSKDRAVPTGEPGISMMPMELNVELFLSTLTIVLGVHERNLGGLLALAGYPPMVWSETKRTALVDAGKRLENLAKRKQ